MMVFDDTAFFTLSKSMRQVTGSIGTFINRIPIKSHACESRNARKIESVRKGCDCMKNEEACGCKKKEVYDYKWSGRK